MISFMSPSEMAKHMAVRAKEKRLSLNLSQKSLAERSGVSYGVIKKFETTGKISLQSLLKLSLILDSLNEFETLFKPIVLETLPTLDDILKQRKRMRGRK